ncbi:MAG: NAD(P)H-dependent oxidoreductase [Spirochaetales bacterium]|nr:NAD(P)H-dependent oxidoreductase [Spirochaetales bacterium]
MKITMVNGANSDTCWAPFTGMVEEICDALRGESHKVDLFTVKNMKMNDCCGCFDCWTKTPGICRYDDEGADFVKSMAHSDKLILFSPVVAGFISRETKKALDRFIPNVLPYITMKKGECLHIPRYGSEPYISLYLFDDGVIDPRAKELIDVNIRRIQRNMDQSGRKAGLLGSYNRQEVSNEIGRS